MLVADVVSAWESGPLSLRLLEGAVQVYKAKAAMMTINTETHRNFSQWTETVANFEDGQDFSRLAQQVEDWHGKKIAELPEKQRRQLLDECKPLFTAFYSMFDKMFRKQVVLEFEDTLLADDVSADILVDSDGVSSLDWIKAAGTSIVACNDFFDLTESIYVELGDIAVVGPKSWQCNSQVQALPILAMLSMSRNQSTRVAP